MPDRIPPAIAAAIDELLVADRRHTSLKGYGVPSAIAEAEIRVLGTRSRLDALIAELAGRVERAELQAGILHVGDRSEVIISGNVFNKPDADAGGHAGSTIGPLRSEFMIHKGDTEASLREFRTLPKDEGSP